MANLTFNDFENKIKLKSTITNILKDTKNEQLREFCNTYINAINNGKAESTLYESFISGSSKWNYINSVDTELSAIAKRVDKYKQEIDLSKIINTMKASESAYIVPLIEEVVLTYVNDKTPANRVVLKDRLMCFHYDPFVNEILNILYYDHAISESFESNFANDIIKNRVTVDKIYSPLQFIKENECVFNVKGTYFVRKGSTINKLSNNDIKLLDESFIKLCNVINSEYVTINENDTITYADDTNIITISENEVIFNGVVLTDEQIKENLNIATLSNNLNEQLAYTVAAYLKEQFNNIAYVNFVKHVKSNVNEGVSFDIFKLKNNLFVNTCDANMGHKTFYRNVNPIQLSNIINEHMDMNVSNLFEELQPEQNKIKKEIEETKCSYEKHISDLQDKKTQLESCKESCDEDDLKNVEEALQEIDAELEKTKEDYKEYQKTADEFLNCKADDADEVEAEAEVDVDNEPELPVDDVETPIYNEEPIEYDGLFDETPTEVIDEYAPQVVKVSYATNIKTNTVANNGEVHILIPSVTANGDITNELQKITFTLADDRTPIISNEYMPVAIYNIIKDAIINDPKTSEVDVNISTDAPVEDIIEEPIEDIITIEEPEENVIDNIYGTDDIPTAAPDAEPEDIKNELIGTDEVVEPKGTDEPQPEDLEASMVIKGLLQLEIERPDLEGEDIELKDLVNYLRDSYISYSLTDNEGIIINIRDAADVDIVKRYFINLGWHPSEFFQFFEELKIYEKTNENVVVKYSSKIENILESNNLKYKVSKRGDKLMIMNALHEGVLITVTDDKTGKTVKINTDELESSDETTENTENTQDVTTFDDSKNAQGEDIKSDEVENEPTEKNESTTERSIKFRVKKQKTDESLGITTYPNKINENNEEIDVMDVVKYKNENGNVISKLNTGEVIISMNNGTTERVRPSQIKLVKDKFKECVCENVKCGVFMNDYCLTPDNCITDLHEFNKANYNDQITIIVEGEKQLIDKKYVKLLD